jgi:sterol desaturase/sphingolipid hydroxylase (fatty acid hydroxylase superfamily)
MLKFNGFPGLDLENGVFRSWWLEPAVASFSFATFIHIYWYYERRKGLSRVKNLSDTFGIDMGDLYNSFAGYWVGVYALKCFASPVKLPDGIPQDMAGLTYLVAEVATGIFIYDAAFFFIHWLLHVIPWLRRVHARHHDSPEDLLEARDVLRHSIFDGSLQVMCNILAQQRTPWGYMKSRLARLIHNVVVTWMLTESHTSSDIPYIWRRWCVGVLDHRLHHFGNDNLQQYQQFFGYLDGFRAWWWWSAANKKHLSNNNKKCV